MSKIILTKRIYSKEKLFEGCEKVIVDTDKCEFSQGTLTPYTKVKSQDGQEFEVNESIESVLNIIKEDEKNVNLVLQNQNQIMDAMRILEEWLKNIGYAVKASTWVSPIKFDRK